MKRFIGNVVMAAVIFSLLTGCAKGAPEAAKEGTGEQVTAPEQEKVQAESEPAQQEKTEETSAEPGSIELETDGDTAALENVMIGMVANTSGIMDESFNQNAWEGLQWLSGTAGIEVDYLEGSSDADIKVAFESLINEGCILCWGVGYTTAPSALEVAREHPEIQFAIVDYVDENIPDNVTCVKFRAAEPSFLVGYVAGMTTESDSVGFVGGMDIDVIKEFQYGYEGGVAYAAKERGKKIEVKSRYADGFFEEAQGKTLAEELYGEGCDIVYHAAGKTGSGVIEAAKEKGKLAIGVDKDQSFLAPENVLTSALKFVNIAVKNVSEDIISGKLEDTAIVDLGLTEDAVGISENHNLYSEEIYDSMMDLKDKILSGELVPPRTEAEYQDFIKK